MKIGIDRAVIGRGHHAFEHHIRHLPGTGAERQQRPFTAIVGGDRADTLITEESAECGAEGLRDAP